MIQPEKSQKRRVSFVQFIEDRTSRRSSYYEADEKQEENKVVIPKIIVTGQDDEIIETFQASDENNWECGFYSMMFSITICLMLLVTWPPQGPGLRTTGWPGH